MVEGVLIGTCAKACGSGDGVLTGDGMDGTRLGEVATATWTMGCLMGVGVCLFTDRTLG